MSFNDVLGFESSSGLYASTPREDFLNHTWQDKNSVIRIEQLEALVRDKVPAGVLDEIRDGLKKVGMSIRLNPYIMDLIDWRNAETDPIRRQFLPMLSELEADHPCMSVDSLEERNRNEIEGPLNASATPLCV